MYKAIVVFLLTSRCQRIVNQMSFKCRLLMCLNFEEDFSDGFYHRTEYTAWLLIKYTQTVFITSKCVHLCSVKPPIIALYL